ncbi:hypothetical protein ACFL96_03670 [Thermoproteota archaeon]
MKRIHKRILIYMFIYGLMVVMAIIGVVVTIKMVPLNDAIQRDRQDLNVIRDENRALQLTILKQTRLDIIEQRATRDLKMRPPKNLNYLRL